MRTAEGGVLPTALQIVHGYNEPFFTLANLYARALQEDGWQVTTVYLTGKNDAAIQQNTLADEVIFFDMTDRQMKGAKLAFIQRIRRLLKTRHFRLVVAQRYKPIYLALLGSFGSAIPVLGISHAFGMLDSAGRRLLLGRFRRRLLLAGVSDAVAEDMRRRGAALQIITLHNCIDAEKLEKKLLGRTEARQRLGLNEACFVFANVGRLHDDKDQGTIIRAFAVIVAHHPQARLLLVGRGKREEKYRALIAELGLGDKALLVGSVPAAATLFRAFDAYVSASDREPFGIVLAEAMLAKLPVISTDCGGAPEVLGEGALYFPRGDYQALAAQMCVLLEMSAGQRENTGQGLYRRLGQLFAFPPFAKRLREALYRILPP